MVGQIETELGEKQMPNPSRATKIRNRNARANAEAVAITPEMLARWKAGGHSRNNARDIANRQGVPVGRMYRALSGRNF